MQLLSRRITTAATARTRVVMRARRRAAMAMLAVATLALGSAATAAIPASERSALQTLYRSTAGDNWIINTGWNGAAGTECDWYGVVCDSAQAHVEGLNLTGDNLSGPLPALDALTGLRLVYMGGNALSGTLPPLAGLSQLATVYFDHNQLTGTLPDLSALLQLRGFVVAYNQFTGPLQDMRALPSMQYVDVSHNLLTGHLPALSGMPNLEYLDVESNQFSGTLPALADLPLFEYFDAGDNQLTGRLPSLAGVPSIEYFGAEDNQLTGPLPALAGLANLEYFDVGGNRLSGALPALSDLPALESFEVDGNALTGTVPSLAALTALTSIDLSGNGFSGALPAPPPNIAVETSTVCNNAFDAVANSAWDDATGEFPWYGPCTDTSSSLTLTTRDVAVATGTRTTILASVGGAKQRKAAGSPAGDVIVSDANGNDVCYLRIDDNGNGQCDVVLVPGSTSQLTGAYSGGSGIAPASVQISKTTPQSAAGDLDQHGWTGAWYNPASSGQGILFEVYPDVAGAGSGLLGGGWFTYDTSAGGDSSQRWYTLTGPAARGSASTSLDIIATGGGNFAAAPVIDSGNGATYAGHASLAFTDCTHGFLSYAFTDGSARVGNIPLTRLDSNITCDAVNGAGNGSAPGAYLLSGAWYVPSTSGQGLLFDINPAQGVTFAAWYTYAPNGEEIGGGASQRWYTLQIGAISSGTATLSNVGLFASQGGVFDAPGTASTTRVGTAGLRFSDCAHLTLDYSFVAGANTGQAGSLALVRAGPTPAGCTL